MTDVTKTCRDLSELKKPAELACRALFYECAMRGINVFVTETYRSPERQKYLYAQGRTRSGQIVTWTLNSNHSGRLAFDIAVCGPKNLYDTPTLEAVGKIANELGITWGGNWRPGIDRPHFEVTEKWTLPRKYDVKVIQGVIVPSNSLGKVQLTVTDKDIYKDKIGYNIAKDAKAFRLMTPPVYKKVKEAKVAGETLIATGYLKYFEVKESADGCRLQSGDYKTIEAAELSAKKIIANDKFKFISINGTLK